MEIHEGDTVASAAHTVTDDGAETLATISEALAQALEIEAMTGAGALEVRRRVMAVTGRVELARRCEQAARAIARNLETGVP